MSTMEHVRPQLNSTGDKDRIQVAVRVKPLNASEIRANNRIAWKFGEYSVEELEDDGVTPLPASKRTLSSPGPKSTLPSNKFFYDNVFPPEAGNEEVYKKQCMQIVKGCMEGYNGTICAYGQTSSGKTYTLMGHPKINPGAGPRAFGEVFDTIDN